MKVRGGLLLGMLLALLTGCEGVNLVPRFDVMPNFQPTTLGFEVEPDNIVVSQHVLTFTARRGSVGGVVEGYQIEYLDPGGNPIRAGDSTLYSRGSLGVPVPAGLACPEEVPPELCTINTPGAVFADRQSQPVSNAITLPGPIALQVLEGEFVGARANVYFTATSDLGQAVLLGPYEVAVVYPVRGE